MPKYLNSFYNLKLFKNLELEKGDTLFLVNKALSTQGDRSLGIPEKYEYQIQEVKGYVINKNHSEVNIKNAPNVESHNFTAYLSAYRGFDESLVTADSLLVVKTSVLIKKVFELELIERINNRGNTLYYVYNLTRTSKSLPFELLNNL